MPRRGDLEDPLGRPHQRDRSRKRARRDLFREKGFDRRHGPSRLDLGAARRHERRVLRAAGAAASPLRNAARSLSRAAISSVEPRGRLRLAGRPPRLAQARERGARRTRARRRSPAPRRARAAPRRSARGPRRSRPGRRRARPPPRASDSLPAARRTAQEHVDLRRRQQSVGRGPESRHHAGAQGPDGVELPRLELAAGRRRNRPRPPAREPRRSASSGPVYPSQASQGERFRAVPRFVYT